MRLHAKALEQIVRRYFHLRNHTVHHQLLESIRTSEQLRKAAAKDA
ncbi:hypothetical protein ETH_00000895 [Eimeria tenella]|uniref:Uncharacterized protein n=1 Tax=Eimeria tenella TaxID=5802 RepID=U6L9P2_EIMTE|nr:hypothetical protein ETH_00000895 [Eimeria tenella]CDJ45289.1 hypothetical protein ETH_00000895 [Eimeria tenella]|eukprot:XP_013236035.1 hypothetical protein ETH_00000895 [Eimeria tenella]